MFHVRANLFSWRIILIACFCWRWSFFHQCCTTLYLHSLGRSEYMSSRGKSRLFYLNKILLYIICLFLAILFSVFSVLYLYSLLPLFTLYLLSEWVYVIYLTSLVILMARLDILGSNPLNLRNKITYRT